MTALTDKHCQACEGSIPKLTQNETKHLMHQIDGWASDEKASHIYKGFEFKDYFHTMAFVNAIAWVAHQENHHPDLEVGYNTCLVRYQTHAVGGLTENDFICAAKIDELTKND